MRSKGRLAWIAMACSLLLGMAAPEDVPMFDDGAVILFQGDSITDGNRGRNADPNHILGHGYAFILAAKNGAAHPEKKWTFLNRGVSGNKVADLEKRWQGDTLDLKPTVLSILVGINDLNGGVSAEDFEAQYDKLLDETVKALPNTRLILLEPFGLRSGKKREAWDTPGGLKEELTQRQVIVRKLSEKYHAIFVPLQAVFESASKKADPSYWIWDGVHPTYAGHQLIADAWEAAVRSQQK